jgi:hypothetical protein
MRTHCVLLCIAAGCGDDPARGTLDFDIDVAVSASEAQIWLSDPALCEAKPFPRPDSCSIEPAEPSCALAPPCLERVAIERDGVVLGVAQLGEPSLAIQASLASGESELVVEGCGASRRLALPAASAEVPVLTDVATDGDTVFGTIMPTSRATSTLASMQGPAGALTCHATNPDSWHLSSNDYPGNLTISSVTETAPRSTPWGTAHVWLLARRPAQPIVVPMPAGAEWDLDMRPPIARLRANGATTYPTTSQWRIITTATGLRHQFVFDGAHAQVTRYAAGELMDSMTDMTPMAGSFSGSFAHVSPTNELDLSVSGDGQFELAVGPVMLTGTATYSFELLVSGSHPLVARIAP